MGAGFCPSYLGFIHLMSARGMAQAPSDPSLTLSLPQVVLESPSSSARAGKVCLSRWMRPWPGASTSQA